MTERPDIARGGTARRGFTLAELLVATGIIVVALSIVAPSIYGLFTAPGDREAEGMVGALMSATRGAAIEAQDYAVLHVQIGVDGECWAAVFRRDHATGRFVPVEGLRPQQVPGFAAFGEVSNRNIDDPAGAHYESDNYRYATGSSYTAAVDDPAGWRGFTTFNVIFSAAGTLVRDVEGAAPEFDHGHAIFSGSGKEKIWDHPGTGAAGAPKVDETGVRMMTVFDYKIANLRPDRAAYLNEVGRFLCINPYTGQLIKLE